MATEPTKEECFEASDIDDVRIIICAKGKHYSLAGNKEACEERELSAKDVRLAMLHILLKTHKIVLPSLEEIKNIKSDVQIL